MVILPSGGKILVEQDITSFAPFSSVHFRTDLEKEAFTVHVPSFENLSSPVCGTLVRNRECHSPERQRDYSFSFAV